MKKVRRKVTRERLVAAIQEAAKVYHVKGHTMTRPEFIAHSEIKHYEIYAVFPTWKDALAAAGIRWEHSNQGAPIEELLEEWGGVARKFGYAPTQREYDHLMGNWRSRALTRRCGMWGRMPEDFRKYAEGKEEWADVVALLPRGPGRRFGCAARGRKLRRVGVTVPDQRAYGAPLNFKNQRYAPVNELGVVCLFGTVSEELGFVIESVHGAFPDCIVKQDMGKGVWQVRRVEFEYESRNFRDHKHPTDGCDIIVCWNHNWPECPANLEVIALSDEIKKRAGVIGF